MMTTNTDIDRIIDAFPRRKTVMNLIPDGSERILDFGCDHGQLLLALRRDKGCRELYGVDVKNDVRTLLEEHLDGSWILDLGDPENELGDEYTGFFNYIVMHDVVEHFSDPWYMLPKIRNYLAESGRMIVVVPNLRNWEFIHELILGRFRYGDGDLMNEEHLRWFTLEGLLELIALSGLETVSCDPMFPPNVDLNILIQRISEPIRTLELPPLESTVGGEKMSIQFSPDIDIRREYTHFLANKFLVVCQRTAETVAPQHTSEGTLKQRRVDP